MAKTTLTIDVRYNPRKTDPEALACAMDRLMETAFSIPGVMNEYANPTMGEFLVAKVHQKGMQTYSLRIDGDLLWSQRQLLLKLVDAAPGTVLEILRAKDTTDLWEGILALLDEIADQGHDRHAIASLLESDEAPGDDFEKSGLAPS